MKKSVAWVIVIVVLVFAIVLNQNNNADSNQENSPIKIGITSLLSGDFSIVGENVVRSAQITIEQINANGGIDGRQVELVVEDAGCDSKTGLSAVSKLINVDNVKYIIGAMCSNGTISAAPIANEGEVIIMTPVTGGTGVDNAGEYIFRTANSDLLAGRDLANAVDKLGFEKVATIAEVTEYTLDIQGSFEARANELGKDLVFSETFQPEVVDFRTQISKLKELKPEAVFVASQTGIGAAYFIKQARELGLEAEIFTDFTFVTNNNAKDVIGTFDDIYFADPEYAEESREWKEFAGMYNEKYSFDPSIPFHSAATYDAIMMLKDAIEEVGDDTGEVKNWLLENVKNREGLTGKFSLDENGNSDLGFVVKRIVNGEYVKVD